MKDNLNENIEKTKKVVTLANELISSSKGDIVYISNCKEAKGHLSNEIKFLDLSEIEVITPEILKEVINQIVSDNNSIEIILLDNISKMINENEVSSFLKKVEEFSCKHNVKILFGLDRENKESINSLDIEKID